MPPDLTIAPVVPATSQAQPRSPAHAAAAQAIFSADTPLAAAVVAPAQGARTSAAPSITTPDSRVVLDPSSDRVVLEYFDATGTLINSRPSQRQLEAYRLAASASTPSGAVIKKP